MGLCTHSCNRLAAAENVILGQGGNVIRLAGLYTESRGPHAYWLYKSRDAALANSSIPVLPGSALALVNLLHYEDAAGAVIALLQSTGTIYDDMTSKQWNCTFYRQRHYPFPKFMIHHRHH